MSAGKIERQPANASAHYIKAREALADAELALSDQVEKVAEMRRNLPQGAIMGDYTFTVATPSGGKRSMSLSDLAADGRSVVIQHMMFGPKEEEPCDMCTLDADGFEGIAPHIAQKVNFAVIAKAPAPKLAEYAAKRGWKRITILSSADNSFNTDMQVEKPTWAPDGVDQMSAISVFKKDVEGKVRHVYTQFPHLRIPDRMERGTDAISPLWNLLDLTPEGRGTE
jgi:predicted dithiol-disulfide oxidoreductase (DUF899 family)